MINREKGQKLEGEEDEIGKIFIGIMEDYQDSVIPPLKDFSPLKGISSCQKGSSSRKRESNEVAETDSIARERGRREKMAEKYSLLQSLVPSLSSTTKVTREVIVTEAINYVERLEAEKKRLEGLKTSLLQQQQMVGKSLLSHCMNSKPSVSVSVCNEIAFFGIQLLVKQGSLIKIFNVFEKYQAEVLVATILVNDYGQLTLTCKFKVGSNGGDVIEKMKKEILSL